MSRRYAVGLSALFCLFLGGMLVLHLGLPDREKSEVENRTLQQVPSFSIGAVLDGSFMEQTEDYIADQFPGRTAGPRERPGPSSCWARGSFTGSICAATG